MTGKEFRAIRREAGLSIRDLAATLRYRDARGIMRIDHGEQPVTGPVAIVMELIRDDLLPRTYYQTAIVEEDAEI